MSLLKNIVRLLSFGAHIQSLRESEETFELHRYTDAIQYYTAQHDSHETILFYAMVYCAVNKFLIMIIIIKKMVIKENQYLIFKQCPTLFCAKNPDQCTIFASA